jgi:YVTN family beta-propeller protein
MTEFRILGSLQVEDDGRLVPLGGVRQRAVLAILLLHRGDVVSVDRIVDELWGEHPPGSATKTAQVYVSRLRKELGQDAVVTRGGGYLLDVEPEQVDAVRFERLAADGRAALERGDPSAAAELLRDALGLWRGPALNDLAYEPFAQGEIARLEELRLAALEHRVEADLALARHTELVSELETVVREHPTRERLRAQLILALYRAGRQTDALASYRDARRVLVEELGLEPSRELQELERAILIHDPGLDAPSRRSPASRSASPSASPSPPAAARRRRARAALVGGALLLLLAALAAIFAAGDDAGRGERASGNSVAVIDPEEDRLIADIPTGVRPADVVEGAGYIWVANRADDTVTQIEPGDREVVSTTSPGLTVGGLAADSHGVWIADTRRTRLVRLDAGFRSVVRSVRVASASAGFGQVGANPLAAGHGSLWTGRSYGAIARVDPEDGEVLSRVSVGNGPSAIAAGTGGVWVADAEDNTVTRLDPASEGAVIDSTSVGQRPTAVAVGEGAVWVANTADDTVSRVDPSTAAVTHTIPVGRRPTGVAAGRGAIWVANSVSGTVSRIDPRTMRVEATVEVGEAPERLAVAHGLVWVSVQKSPRAAPAPAGAPGGVARMLVANIPDTTDPALDSDTARHAATCARLYSYPDRPFPDGARLQPEVAGGPPAVSADGRTYAFEIRSGFRFSPPSNEPVTAAAFERAIERALDPRTGSFAAELAKDVAHVSSRGNRLTVRLRRPSPSLTSLLAAQYFCAVPPNTPIDTKGVDVIPTAGPYYVASLVPGRSLVLRRNPNYAGPRPSRLAEIRFTAAMKPEKAIAAVEAGRADYVELNPPGEPGVSGGTARRLAARYGAGSEAARAGRQQLFTQPTPNIYFFIFNNRRGPFADVRLRRAVNFAMDRRALALNTGGGEVGRPTDQHIPPGLPGFEDAQIYPLGGPDLEAARRLAGGARRRAVLYTCDFPGCSRHGQILKADLSAIGIDLEVREFSIPELFRRLQTPGEQFDIGYANWFFDYADPSSYINDQFGDEGFFRAFEGERWQRRMDAVARLSGERRMPAYARLDRELAAQAAPAAPFATGTTTHLLSARMGCEVLHPVWGIDLAALCVSG